MSSLPKLSVALVHHPVLNKKGEVVASAVTNLDIHDIARAACTYGVGAYYVVTPLKDQQAVARRIVEYWTRGHGARYNPDRRRALELVRVVVDMDQVVARELGRVGGRPVFVATDARKRKNSIGYGQVKSMLAASTPVTLVFGTAWGLAKEILDTLDFMLAPVLGPGVYNHLSVRSAASVILDRIAGY